MRSKTFWFVLAFLVGLSPAVAQQQQQQQPSAGLAPTRPKLPYSRNKDEFKRDILTRAPDLPDLPPYGGNAKFKEATVSPNARGGTTFTLVYSSDDTPQQITDWYSRSLGQSKWTILGTNPGHSVSASKGKNYVSVQATSRSSAASKCDMFVIYRQMN